jgi:hypothetical protein
MLWSKHSLVGRRAPIDTLRLPKAAVLGHPKKQIEKKRQFLAASDQLVHDAPDGEILCGGEFWLTLNANDATEVVAVIVKEKIPAELKAIGLAVQRIPLETRWDDIKNVRLVLEAGVKFDLDLASFDAPEIDNYLNLDLPKSTVEATSSAIPPIDDQVSKLGSIWALSDHRIDRGNPSNAVAQRRLARPSEINHGA